MQVQHRFFSFVSQPSLADVVASALSRTWHGVVKFGPGKVDLATRLRAAATACGLLRTALVHPDVQEIRGSRLFLGPRGVAIVDSIANRGPTEPGANLEWLVDLMKPHPQKAALILPPAEFIDPAMAHSLLSHPALLPVIPIPIEAFQAPFSPESPSEDMIAVRISLATLWPETGV